MAARMLVNALPTDRAGVLLERHLARKETWDSSMGSYCRWSGRSFGVESYSWTAFISVARWNAVQTSLSLVVWPSVSALSRREASRPPWTIPLARKVGDEQGQLGARYAARLSDILVGCALHLRA